MSGSPQPFYSSNDEGLYCCLHGGGESARTGVVCVQPLFGEYIQHHRAFFILAERLARTGIPCLRYDHHATGDSAGDLPEASLLRWLQDIEVMAATLVHKTGIERVVLVGARFGATLALHAVTRIVRAVGLALWEMLWNGHAYLDPLLHTHRKVLASCSSADEEVGDGTSLDVLGFEIPIRLWDEISAFESDGSRIAPDLDVLLLGSARALEGADRLHGHERLFLQPVEYPRGWLEPERGMYDVLVPTEALGHLSQWIEARA